MVTGLGFKLGGEGLGLGVQVKGLELDLPPIRMSINQKMFIIR
jgi:hypothetical protein